MKKLLLLLLVFTGMVSTASAYGTFYLNCEANSWGDGTSLPFIYKASNSYYYVLDGNNVKDGDFYFRIYATWDDNSGGHHIMPINNGDVVPANSENPLTTDVKWNDQDKTRAFKIEKNTSAKAVIIYAAYNTSSTKFEFYIETLTSSSTVAYVNNTNWSDVYAYTYDNRDIKVKGAWPGTKLEAANGVYSVEVPYSQSTTIIFNNGNSGTNNQTDNITLEHNAVYNKSGVIANQEVTVSKYGMSTFCSQYPLDFSTASPSGLKAYRIYDFNNATGELLKEEVTKVPAGVGVYIEGASGESETLYSVSPTATATSIGTNMLVGTVSQIDNLPQVSDIYTNFILTVNKDGEDVATPKFFKVNTAGNTVLAGKAYLQIPTASAAREFFWFEENTTTAIEAVKKEQKENGEYYNLAGQRVAQPAKGLYIVNGKKVIMK